jgi:hypothetical protein
VKLNCSKLSNKDDLISLIGLVVMLFLFAFVIYLASKNSFLAGFVAATITWKWHDWLYKPIDSFIDRNWPSRTTED